MSKRGVYIGCLFCGDITPLSLDLEDGDVLAILGIVIAEGVLDGHVMVMSDEPIDRAPRGVKVTEVTQN